jgi:hypothetical protein
MHRSTAMDGDDDDDDGIPRRPSILDDDDDDDDDENIPPRKIADNGAIVLDHPEQRRGTAISFWSGTIRRTLKSAQLTSTKFT